MRRLSSISSISSISFLVLSACPLVRLSAQTGGFVTRLGTDTVAIERFTRSGNRLEGEIVTRIPRVIVRTYWIEWGANGRATRGEVTQRRPGEANPVNTATATFTADSVMAEVRTDSTVRRRLAMPGNVLLVPAGPNQSWAITELMADRLRSGRVDSIMFPGYLVGATAGFQVSWVRAGRDSVRILAPGGASWMGRLGSSGRFEGARPVTGTQLFAIERISPPDVQAIATAWRARESQPAATGPLSPRDTTRATIGGANLLIDYGRPSKRGRVVFGSPVAPWGEVWRTGANAATQFRTDRPLEIGGVVVQPGFYTLWTIPSQSGWKLLINSQTGQWGTAHDPTRDIFQLDMQTMTLSAPVERFTISVSPGSSANAGVIHLDWDTTRASIPFTVRN